MNYPTRVVLIDDDQDDGFIFKIALTNLSNEIQLIYYQDGEIAVSMLSDPKVDFPDLLFIDWNMPKLSGSYCLQAISKIPGYDNIPIIICSTSGYEDLKMEASKLGATYFLVKPATINELTEKLKELFTMIFGDNRKTA